MKSISACPAPFGDYFVDRFTRLFPHFSTYLRPDQAALAAHVYLFRFDSRLSTDFVHNNIDAFSRSIADASGKSVAESRRLFTTNARDAARCYFADGWHDVSQYVDSNSPALSALQKQNIRHVALRDFVTSDVPIREVDPVILEALMDSGMPVVVFVFAKYCSVCKEVAPLFETAARQATDSDELFVALNGPLHPEVNSMLKVGSYPAILRVADGKTAEHYPALRTITVDNIISFAQAQSIMTESRTSGAHAEEFGAETVVDETTPGSPGSPGSPGTPGTPGGRKWAALLKRQGIDELDVLAAERDAVMHSKIDRAIQCGGDVSAQGDSSGEVVNSCRLIPHRVHGNGTVVTAAVAGSSTLLASPPPPICVLLGGGMGAGKTTVVNWVTDTAFWQAYGEGVVVVEADAFKLSDPLFQMLQGVTPLASRIVHRDSIVAAEELLLKAVNSRRDVVFDGTLSWCEYARQTITMLRDTEYYYERGPGYVEQEDGNAGEVYWLRTEKREVRAAAYRVELVAVTAEADISVMRGIVRKITTGRGVSVQDQLKSHALFSQHFERYVGMVDAAYLFDTTLQHATTMIAEGGRHEFSDKLVGVKEGLLFKTPEDVVGSAGDEKFVVRFADAYERFLRKRWLNVNASKAEELFIQEAVQNQR